MKIDLNFSLGSDDLEDEATASYGSQNNESQLPMFDDELTNSSRIGDEIELKLDAGCVVPSLDQFYILYCEYAHAKGFSVKKGDQTYFPMTREIKSKEFECSCEGLANEKRTEGKIGIYQKRVTRTKCKARIRVARERDGPWKVSRFVKDHNHEMVEKGQSYLLRSSRNLSHGKKMVLEAMQSVGIRISNVMSFMEKESGGPQNVGFTRKDAYNHISRLRKQTKIENGDANALVQYFINKSNVEPLFYWDRQLDDEGRLMNLFFRDARCAVDYSYFGDVVSFDTTYKTNKYDMICAPFVGINHHMTNVMFGMAFLSDETMESFEWLFTTFMDSMKGSKQPGVIFTDQDKAMMNAIEKVFPNSYHRLCQWHINQNAPSHFGHLNGDSTFKKLWHTCMNRCTSVDEFERLWKYMIEVYDLHKISWFERMYKIRQKWASAFSNDRFSAELLATSRSEITNKVLKEMCTRTMSLYDFVLHYERIQANWRVKENAQDTYCLSKPGQVLKKNNLLNHAAQVYTHNVYKDFQFQFLDSLNTVFAEYPSDYNARVMHFKFFSESEGSIRHVIFDNDSHTVTCSCRRWETHGIFCKHILKVYNTMNVTQIPDDYTLKRWTIQAKQRRLSSGAPIHSSKEIDPVLEMAYVNQIMRSMYELTQSSKSHGGARHLVRSMIDKLNGDVTSLLTSTHCDRPSDDLSSKKCDTAEFYIRDPPMAKSKGSKKTTSIKQHWDTNNEKGKRKSAKITPEAKQRKHVEPEEQVRASERQFGTSDGLSSFIPWEGHNPFQSSQQSSSNIGASPEKWHSSYLGGSVDNFKM